MTLTPELEAQIQALEGKLRVIRERIQAERSYLEALKLIRAEVHYTLKQLEPGTDFWVH